jgi:ribonuclease E
MSRQRLRTSLGESSQVTCPRCQGQGTIRGVESLGLSVIRLIEEEALKDNTVQVRAILPIEIAAYLLNEKRQAIIDIEKRQNVSVIVVPSPHFLTPQYEVERIRSADLTEKDEKLASYKLAIKPEVSNQYTPVTSSQKPHYESNVKNAPIEELAPTKPIQMQHIVEESAQQGGQPGLLKKLFNLLFDKKAQQPSVRETSPTIKPTGSTARYSPNQRRRKGSSQHHGTNRRQHVRGRSVGGSNKGATHHRYRDNRDTRIHETKELRHEQQPGRESFSDHLDQPSTPVATVSQQRQPLTGEHTTSSQHPYPSSTAPQPVASGATTTPMQVQAVPFIKNEPLQTHKTASIPVVAPLQIEMTSAKPGSAQVETPSQGTNVASAENDTSPTSLATGAPPRKHRGRFHPRRHRHHRKPSSKQHSLDTSHRHELEGEDIYSTKKKDNE